MPGFRRPTADSGSTLRKSLKFLRKSQFRVPAGLVQVVLPLSDKPTVMFDNAAGSGFKAGVRSG